MELWIRSQDKRRLIKITQIEYTNSGYYGAKDKQWSILCQDEIWIGSYKTEERTLEILDDIQEFLEQKDYEGNRYYEDNVYNMPKE